MDKTHKVYVRPEDWMNEVTRIEQEKAALKTENARLGNELYKTTIERDKARAEKVELERALEYQIADTQEAIDAWEGAGQAYDPAPLDIVYSVRNRAKTILAKQGGE